MLGNFDSAQCDVVKLKTSTPHLIRGALQLYLTQLNEVEISLFQILQLISVTKPWILF